MKKFKFKKKYIFIAVLAVALVLVVKTLSGAGGSVVNTVSVTTMEKGDLIDSISLKGTVESNNTHNVYTTLTYKVEYVDVEVGDYVTEGQVLAQLDTEDLEYTIAQQKASLDANQQSALNQLEVSKRNYSNAASNLSSGKNATLISAESSLESAKVQLETAQRNYDDALNDLNGDVNSAVVSAQSSLETAQLDLDNKTTTYENNKVLYESGIISKSDLDASETAYNNSLNTYNNAVKALEDAQATESRSLESAKSSLESAQISYNNALASYNAALTSANQELDTYKSNVESAEIAANLDASVIYIQSLESQLEKSTITSPISGTVTAVYAKVGQTASGLLFVIEDTDDLIIETKIKEYDISSVAEGMDVVIKSDATGEDEFNGSLSKVYPAAAKTAAGETDTSSSNVEFGAEVSISDTDTPLRVGLSVRLTLVLENAKDVFYVPFDAITTNESGENIVYLMVQEGEGYVAKATTVETGLETDFYTEISGSEIVEGAQVISDAAGIVEGMSVMPRVTVVSEDEQMGFYIGM